MTYDSNVPATLKSTQQWFASIITRPIDQNSQMNPISPSGAPMEEEAANYIVASPTLQPHQRIQIYNQQYWWRFLSNLHETFLLTVRLFGYADFNFTIGISYLEKYAPNHWSLSFLGNRLPQWIEEEYHAEDKQLIFDAVRVDWAYNEAFVAEHKPSLENTANLSEAKLMTQPHLHLFNTFSDLFSFRAKFVEHDPDYWVKHDFPPLDKKGPYYFVLYRNKRNNVCWEELSESEYKLLEYFSEGRSIEEACEWSGLSKEAEKHLQEWFHKWTVKQWLAVVS